MKSLAFLLALSLPFPALAAPQIMRQAMQPPAAQPVQQAAPPAPQPRFVLEDGTPVKLVLNETVSSANQHKGNLVIFAVAEDVKIGSVIVIPKGANAWATITIARSKGKIGRAGRIELSVDKVRLADGEKVELSDIEGGNGDSRQAQMATAMAVSGVLAWPATPLFLLMHGKDITMQRGAATMAFVHGDNTLDPARFTPEAIALANNLPPPVSPAVAATAPPSTAPSSEGTPNASVPSASASATLSPAPIASTTAASVPSSASTPNATGAANAVGVPNTAAMAPEAPGPAPAPAATPTDENKPQPN
jgi:hypothetical protein